MRILGKKWDMDEINFARKCVGLSPLKHKQKNCSRCSVLFITTSQNICCDNCREKNNTYFDYYGEYGDNNVDV